MINEYPNFLTEQESEMLMSLGESGSLTTGTTNGHLKGYRKAKVRWFNEQHPLVEKIKREVATLSGTEIHQQEKFHFVKYEPDGEYKPHYDGRYKTALIYLNTGFVGGETYFPKIDRTIKPEIGKLIIWQNTDSQKRRIEESYHAGLPVEFGTKYIGVIWIKH
jgi:hypothetical protein